MAEITEQSISVSEIEPGILEIANHQVHASGADMSSKLVFDRTSAGWLAGQVSEAVTGYFPEVDELHGPDRLNIFMGGSEWQPFIHVHNHRDAAAARGGTTYTLIFTTEIGRALVDALRKYAAA